MATKPWIVYGTAWKKERTADLVYSAVKAGFRGIDTANQLKHYYEEGVGAALKKCFSEGIQREDLWIQTKFTPVDSQDHRMPYDPKSPLKTQVIASFESSLKHLGVTYLDSMLLHGPYNFPLLGDEDWEVWRTLEGLYESKKVKQIGISNVNPLQLDLLIKGAKVKPMAVQNRCYANKKWDSETREICRTQKIDYQGFSLLTANPQVLRSPRVAKLAVDHHCSPEQVVFAFAREVGMTPLTGTTNVHHMEQDLDAQKVNLPKDELHLIEELDLSHF